MPVVAKFDRQVIKQNTISLVDWFDSENRLHGFNHDLSIQQVGKTGNELKQFFLLKVLLV